MQLCGSYVFSFFIFLTEVGKCANMTVEGVFPFQLFCLFL